MTSDEYRRYICKIFNTYNIVENYNKENIIFEESFVHDGIDIDDIELYEHIFQLMGESNFSVKLHPRACSNRFAKYKCDVHLPEGVPWEAIALSCVNKHYKLFALGSGSIINCRLLLGDGTKAILLYKCLDKKPKAFGKNFDLFIQKFMDKYPCGVIIPSSLDELDETLSRI